MAKIAACICACTWHMHLGIAVNVVQVRYSDFPSSYAASCLSGSAVLAIGNLPPVYACMPYLHVLAEDHKERL